jgi:hypothetical protein
MKTCTVEGCEKAHNAKGFCNTHYYRLKRNGTLERFRPTQRGPSNPNWKGDRAAYTTVHSRLKSERGAASAQDCVECGSQAEDWAYTYGCDNEMKSDFGPYSTDMDQYQPMCRPCHKKFDFVMEAGRVPA